MATNQKKLAILAVGGNSLIIDEKHKTVQDQYAAVERDLQAHRRPDQEGLPRGGHARQRPAGRLHPAAQRARRATSCTRCRSTPAAPTPRAPSATRCSRRMYNEMRAWPSRPVVATVVTQVLVDRNDPSFKKPTKPIGSFMDEDDGQAAPREGRLGRRRGRRPRLPPRGRLAAARRRSSSSRPSSACSRTTSWWWRWAAAASRWSRTRRATSPAPTAVIDKDLATSLLARELKADLLIISTAVEKVYLNYGSPTRRTLDRITAGRGQAVPRRGPLRAGQHEAQDRGGHRVPRGAAARRPSSPTRRTWSPPSRARPAPGSSHDGAPGIATGLRCVRCGAARADRRRPLRLPELRRQPAGRVRPRRRCAQSCRARGARRRTPTAPSGATCRCCR